MDCFYAAVETKYRPELKGKPLGIGGPAQSRSVLCTANYEARKYGVRAAMPSSVAVRKCPHLILIPPHFELYKKESQAVRQILERFTNKIEPLSLDEAYLDVTDSPFFSGSATLIAKEIRKMIFQELQLTASAGIAPNKFLAKVASDWNKPNGQFVIAPNQVADFVKDLKVEKIFGVGKVTATRMRELGLMTCGDLYQFGLPRLKNHFGSRGEDLFYLSQGIDHRSVSTSDVRKSLTVEETYGRDLTSWEDVKKRIPSLFNEWNQRMIRYQLKCQQKQLPCQISGHVVKIKYFDFKSSTHECADLGTPSIEKFYQLIENLWLKRSAPVRLLGLGVRLNSRSRSASTFSDVKYSHDTSQNLSFWDLADCG